MSNNPQVTIEGTDNHIRIFNGLIGLTDTEISILAEFIDLKKSMDNAGIEVNPFSTEMKKNVAKNLGRDDFNTLNNYIKSFVDKGAIRKTDGEYRINPLLIPVGEKETIIFVIDG